MSNAVSIAQSGANNVTMRNRIINGAMVISQRGTSFVSPTDAYTIDRWEIREDTDGAVTVTQETDAPTGFTQSVKITTTTADASLGATQRLLFSQFIEGFNTADLSLGTASAQTVTLSFWTKSSLTGTFAGSLQNNTRNRSYVFNYTISSANTWEYKTVTVAGDTAGTWIGATNGLGLRVNFALGVGSTYSGTAGSWQASDLYSSSGAVSVIGTLSATWQVTGVQLEKGSTATPFEQRLYGTELSLCSRYFQNAYTALYKNSSGSTAIISDKLHTVMRAAPTIVVVSRTAVIGTDWGTDTIGTFYVEWGNGTSGEQRNKITYTASAEL
jgi:hypothetical protein